MVERCSRLLVALLLAAPVSSFAFSTFTTRAVNLRAGPDRSFDVMAVVPAHTALRVTGCQRGWRWCMVVTSRYQGWMDSYYFRHAVQGRAPIIQDPNFAPGAGRPHG
ncbi:SH3 domain-containing protein [Variovorax sp. OV329]|uniref:SH3 domain-containing protein n=1 Tax=Variovorax sp. OV329 TaxID=1882825 RepID=UPI0008EC8F70|nr:SH3 domain-containing protein [Variovorax sp. OV329]SFM03656.1 hypothetical protein SAMN05444747_102104 [Variovorax sp. OV329]